MRMTIKTLESWTYQLPWLFFSVGVKLKTLHWWKSLQTPSEYKQPAAVCRSHRELHNTEMKPICTYPGPIPAVLPHHIRRQRRCAPCHSVGTKLHISNCRQNFSFTFVVPEQSFSYCAQNLLQSPTVREGLLYLVKMCTTLNKASVAVLAVFVGVVNRNCCF